MPKTKKTKLKRHKIDTIRDLGKSLDKSTQSSTHRPLRSTVLAKTVMVKDVMYSAQYWKKLPQFELYIRRERPSGTV